MLHTQLLLLSLVKVAMLKAAAVPKVEVHPVPPVSAALQRFVEAYTHLLPATNANRGTVAIPKITVLRLTARLTLVLGVMQIRPQLEKALQMMLVLN